MHFYKFCIALHNKYLEDFFIALSILWIVSEGLANARMPMSSSILLNATQQRPHLAFAFLSLWACFVVFVHSVSRLLTYDAPTIVKKLALFLARHSFREPFLFSFFPVSYPLFGTWAHQGASTKAGTQSSPQRPFWLVEKGHFSRCTWKVWLFKSS